MPRDLAGSTTDPFVCSHCGARDLSDPLPEKSPPASLIEALGAFGAAFHDRAMPAERVFHGAAQEAVTGDEP
jgi:hypothetical protein